MTSSDLLSDLNSTYLKFHHAKENAFWAQYMDLSSKVENGKPGSMEVSEIEWKNYIANPSALPKIRQALNEPAITAETKTGLEGWKTFFETHSIESQDAKDLQAETVRLEGLLAQKRMGFQTGYQIEGKDFVPCSSVQLGLLLATSDDEATRKAAWLGLRAIEVFVLENGYLEIVKKRNQLGRLLGFEDYYDYKVRLNERISKKELFKYLDELETDTRSTLKNNLEKIQTKHGASATEPWNLTFFSSGSLAKELDPYFPFQKAIQVWGESFSALKVDYSGCELTLDLVARKGKYENGFMHGPNPALQRDQKFTPAKINFTAYCVPGQVGSGQNALQTLLHEGGHAAHFANIRMPAPCFAQEFAPTSVAFAETQSMFMDSLMDDAGWRRRYARNLEGQPMPAELIVRAAQMSHAAQAQAIRGMLAIVYSEKAIYELSDGQLTKENVLEAIRTQEKRLTMQSGAKRPALSVPHLLSGESSAYYHGYVLAEMAVHQTRAFFTERDGSLLDNAKIGPDLARAYWKLGNLKPFTEFVKDLTGQEFSGKAIVARMARTSAEVEKECLSEIAHEASRPRSTAKVALNATIKVVHGDQLIADSSGGFEALSEKFGQWIESLSKNQT